jgi:uncharacterized membrane protein YraQ (UPF0718 family)
MDTTLLFVYHLFATALTKVWGTFAHNWPYLLLSIVISVVIRQYVDQERIAAFLRRNEKGSVWIATAAAVGTPFCSCGTTAVVLGMMATMMPWAPIVAFLVASPLTSPEGMFYTAGLFGWPFSIAYMVASILLGLAGGTLAYLLEKRGWLRDQARMAGKLPVTGGVAAVPAREPVSLRTLGLNLFRDGSRLLLMFFGFAFVGYLINGLIPAEWITALFGSGNVYSVPLAGTLGLPFYINSEASLPLVRAMLDSGMSQGAALAFLITGSGTSIGAMGGLLTIARRRVVVLVIGTLWLGAILIGLAYDLLLKFM